MTDIGNKVTTRTRCGTIDREWEQDGYIYKEWYGRSERFRIVDEIPEGPWKFWNIPRDAFADQTVIPFVMADADCHVIGNTHIAYRCKDVAEADSLWEELVCKVNGLKRRTIK